MHFSIERLQVHLGCAKQDMEQLVFDRKALAASTAKNAADIVDKQAEIDNLKLAIDVLKGANNA